MNKISEINLKRIFDKHNVIINEKGFSDKIMVSDDWISSGLTGGNCWDEAHYQLTPGSS